MILVEHKSRGKDLEKAYKQAKDYFPGLTEKELPRYILVSDFEHFKLYDLEETHNIFLSNDFNIIRFSRLIKRIERPCKHRSTELMGKLAR